MQPETGPKDLAQALQMLAWMEEERRHDKAEVFKLQQLVEQLSEIVRKEDYRFRNEPRGEEVGASLRAIGALCGPYASAK